MVKKRNTRARAEGMTQISISLPEALVSQIDAMAATDRRNRSNFIAITLDDLAKERGVTPTPKA